MHGAGDVIYKGKPLDFDYVKTEAFHSRDSKWTKKTCENFFEENKMAELGCFWLSNWGEKGYFGFGDLIRILNIFLNLESEETVIR